MNKIVEKIGLPALLEQCAEECSELTHACLKLARKMREENYTPKTMEECIEALKEEIADVELCLNAILDTKLICTDSDIVDIYFAKEKRWKERLGIGEADNV